MLISGSLPSTVIRDSFRRTSSNESSAIATLGRPNGPTEKRGHRSGRRSSKQLSESFIASQPFHPPEHAAREDLYVVRIEVDLLDAELPDPHRSRTVIDHDDRTTADGTEDSDVRDEGVSRAMSAAVVPPEGELDRRDDGPRNAQSRGAPCDA